MWPHQGWEEGRITFLKPLAPLIPMGWLVLYYLAFLEIFFPSLTFLMDILDIFSSFISCLIVCNCVIYIAFFLSAFCPFIVKHIASNTPPLFDRICFKTAHRPARNLMKSSFSLCALALALVLVLVISHSLESWCRTPESLQVRGCRSQVSTSSSWNKNKISQWGVEAVRDYLLMIVGYRN